MNKEPPLMKKHTAVTKCDYRFHRYRSKLSDIYSMSGNGLFGKFGNWRGLVFRISRRSL